jgi:two-component system, NarL family, response regulator DevR
MNGTEMRRIRVLIVDDHELVRAGMRTLLAADPEIEVVAEAASGTQALARARERQPQVVLLDAHLPDIGGAEVCRRLHAELPGVAVAMLTTFSNDELVRAGVRAGANGYLLKDIERLDLGRNIRALARGEAVIDPKVAPLVLAAARLAGQSAESDQTLSERQRDVLRLVAEGRSNREIAERMYLSELTVKGYIEEILRQLGARNRVHAAILATKRGWI